MKVNCPNMNHGRSNPKVKFCPNCGETLDRSSSTRCDGQKHATYRKERHVYCMDCGKKLSTV